MNVLKILTTKTEDFPSLTVEKLFPKAGETNLLMLNFIH